MPDNEQSLVLQRQRQLKWRSLDWLESFLMMLCGFTLAAFCTSVILDIITREIGRPWLFLQEVTSTFFIYGIFIGAALATRRNDHLYLTAFAEAMTGRARIVAEMAIEKARKTGMAFVGAVVGEYLGSAKGVGYLIHQAEGSFDINTVFAGILLLTMFALVLDQAVSVAERRLLVWRPSQAGDADRAL